MRVAFGNSEDTACSLLQVRWCPMLMAECPSQELLSTPAHINSTSSELQVLQPTNWHRPAEQLLQAVGALYNVLPGHRMSRTRPLPQD